jgi:hypothetical protein
VRRPDGEDGQVLHVPRLRDEHRLFLRELQSVAKADSQAAGVREVLADPKGRLSTTAGSVVRVRVDR